MHGNDEIMDEVTNRYDCDVLIHCIGTGMAVKHVRE